MKLRAVSGDILEYKCDVLAVNLFEGVKEPGGATGAVDKALGGAVAKLIGRGEFTGKKGETAVVEGMGKIGAGRVLVVGLGKKEKFGLDGVRAAAAATVKRAKSMKAEKLAAILHGAGAGGLDAADAAMALAEGALIGDYKFDKYKTKGKDGNNEGKGIREITVVEREKSRLPVINKGLKLGEILAASTNIARDMVNEPANVMTPGKIAAIAKALSKSRKLKVRVYDKQEIKAMKMEALLAVNRGSREQPYFITIEYKGDPKSKKALGLVGKGITFDSGGISLKPSSAMDDMKCDMSGAAAVVGAMDAIEKLGLKINVTGVIPTTDNKTGGDAQCIGDVIRASGGKTIEVMNTDAEGRLILCDAITWAVKNGLEPIIDMATLTGACVVALGAWRTGLFTSDDELAAAISECGDKSGELMWRMPVDEEYFDAIKSDVADIKNVGDRNAGATTAALFLKEFTEGKRWAHLDIAGTAFLNKPQSYWIKGATGTGVRAMTLLAMKMAGR